LLLTSRTSSLAGLLVAPAVLTSGVDAVKPPARIGLDSPAHYTVRSRLLAPVGLRSLAISQAQTGP